jgi:aminoglycoside phosphotransferase
VDEIERLLGRPVEESAQAAWGFQNRTDIVLLEGGERVVVQRYRRRSDAAYRLRVMQGLWGPAREAGIAVPRVREADLDASPPWVVFDALPGEPVPAGGSELVVAMAVTMGGLLATFRSLPFEGLALDGLWADPVRLAARFDRPGARSILDSVPSLFAGRPVVLAHGDFAPVNVLTDGAVVTGLLDFESVRLADPLFDVAWWAWSVGFSPAGVLEAAWPEFLRGAGIDPAEPLLAERVRALQVLRMLELLDGDSLSDDVRAIVETRLASELG